MASFTGLLAIYRLRPEWAINALLFDIEQLRNIIWRSIKNTNR